MKDIYLQQILHTLANQCHQGSSASTRMCDSHLILHKNSIFEQFTFLDAFAKLRKASMSFTMPVCPSAWNYSPPPHKKSQNFIFDHFLKICPQNSSFFKL